MTTTLATAAATASLVRTRAVLASVDDALGVLTDVERARAAAFVHDTDRDDFVAAHVLVRQVVAGHLGDQVGVDDVRIVQVCAECAGPHGRPRVETAPGVHVSLAHTRGWVAAVAADRPCGVDVELLAGLAGRPVPLRALATAERRWVAAAADDVRAFGELWVRKEAVVKAGGATLDDAARIDVVDGSRLAGGWGGYDLRALAPDDPADAGATLAAVAVGGP